MELQHFKMQILGIGLLLLAAYIGGKIAQRFKIGEVVGQIFGGVLVGPHFLELIHRVLLQHETWKELAFFQPMYHFYETSFPEYANVLESYHFFVFLFLGMIAFSIGEELHRDRLRQVGVKAMVICVLQAMLTFLFLFLSFWRVFHFPLIQALLIGSIGIATAPALTFILMHKLRIEGTLKNMLANIVVLDDIIEVIFFSIFLGIAVTLQHGEQLSATHLSLAMVEELVFAGLIGTLIFLVLKLSLKKQLPPEEYLDEEDRTFLSTMLSEHPTPSVEILVIVMGIVAVGIAVAIHFHLPFLITAIVGGFLIANFHSHAIFDSLKIENVMPLFNLMFFAVIGSTVQLESFTKDSLVYIMGYLVMRAAGKLLGNWGGCVLTRQDSKITACLPKLMLPQAGMAAVETILVAAVLKESGGVRIFNTIIPALVVFELGGAWLSERTLIKWREWTVGEREAFTAPDRGEHDFSLARLLGDRVFEMMATTKEEAIFELARFCVRRGIVPEVEIVKNLVWEREQLGSTGIGDGIALPHCRTGVVDQTLVVCGILRQLVDWNAPDHQPVDLVFLIINPDQYPEHHLKAIRTISIALQHADFKRDVKQALLQNTVVEYVRRFSTIGRPHEIWE